MRAIDGVEHQTEQRAAAANQRVGHNADQPDERSDSHVLEPVSHTWNEA